MKKTPAPVSPRARPVTRAQVGFSLPTTSRNVLVRTGLRTGMRIPASNDGASDRPQKKNPL
jgi:hypothetical protein